MAEEWYNTKITQYADSVQVAHYNKHIVRGRKKDESAIHQKNETNPDRTEEQEKRCIMKSLKRSKNRIYHLARGNEWEWFITFTFDRCRTDASEYDLVVKRLTEFLNNTRKRKAPNLIYLVVPELHADGKNYHFHGLLANTGTMHFRDSGKTDSDGKTIYNVLDWYWGFSTATKVEDSGRVSGYITKYITEDICQFLKNKKRYYASRNIVDVEPEFYQQVNRSELIEMCAADGIDYLKKIEMPYSTEYCREPDVIYMELNK